MKKILCLILMVMILAIGKNVSADYIRGSTGDKLETYVVYGTDEVVSTTYIPTGTRILGFTVSGDGAAAAAGLYDTAALSTTTSTTVIAEASAPSDQTDSIWFPMPYIVTTQLTVVVDASTTAVTIYYE